MNKTDKFPRYYCSGDEIGECSHIIAAVMRAVSAILEHEERETADLDDHCKTLWEILNPLKDRLSMVAEFDDLVKEKISPEKAMPKEVRAEFEVCRRYLSFLLLGFGDNPSCMRYVEVDGLAFLVSDLEDKLKDVAEKVPTYLLDHKDLSNAEKVTLKEVAC